MKNFEFLFAAWACVWAVFFVYEIGIGLRLSRLRDDVERLKRELGERR
jgi:hypothetical protein